MKYGEVYEKALVIKDDSSRPTDEQQQTKRPNGQGGTGGQDHLQNLRRNLGYLYPHRRINRYHRSLSVVESIGVNVELATNV